MPTGVFYNAGDNVPYLQYTDKDGPYPLDTAAGFKLEIAGQVFNSVDHSDVFVRDRLTEGFLGLKLSGKGIAPGEYPITVWLEDGGAGQGVIWPHKDDLVPVKLRVV